MNIVKKIIGVLCLILIVLLTGCSTSLDQIAEVDTFQFASDKTEMETPQNSTQLPGGTSEITATAVEMISPSTITAVPHGSESNAEGQVQILSTPDPSVTITSIPTPLPVIEEPTSCESEAEGHILFLSSEYKKRLFVMDGNACNVYQVVEDISGSPDWAVDGQKIAVGCENNNQICIFDAEKTMNSCQESEDGGVCEAVIQEKIPLPEEAGEKEIYNVSWASDGEKLLVEYAVLPRPRDIYLVYLEEPVRWEKLVASADIKTDISPTEDRIMMDGLIERNLEKGLIQFYLLGEAPQWSPDGEYLAFLQPDGRAFLDGTEPMRLAGMITNVDKNRWYYFYATRLYDSENWQRRNIIFSDNEYRLLSWSPDSKYIAFVGDYRYEGDSQIFRLDTETGEIFVLTTKLDDVYGEMQYIAPAWGP